MSIDINALVLKNVNKYLEYSILRKDRNYVILSPENPYFCFGVIFPVTTNKMPLPPLLVSKQGYIGGYFNGKIMFHPDFLTLGIEQQVCLLQKIFKGSYFI